jgi:hypothetical protein
LDDFEEAQMRINALEFDRDDPIVSWAEVHCVKESGLIDQIDQNVSTRGLDESLFTMPQFGLSPLYFEEKQNGHLKKPYKSKKWGVQARQNEGLRSVILDQISSWSDGPRAQFSKSDQFVTMGSCFATNLAAGLRNQNIRCRNYNFPEEINNTYTNLDFVNSLSPSENGALEVGSVQQEYYDLIRNAQAVIYTCGTSIAFRDGGGNIIIPKRIHEMVRYGRGESLDVVNVSVDENFSNLIKIIGIIQNIQPDIKIIMTVSPVPLARTFGSESAVIADCVSKSSLRVAVDMVIRENVENVYYWPSFEIAKWLLPHYGGHVSPSLFFGADDGESRHVSKEMIDTIVGSFIDYAFTD